MHMPSRDGGDSGSNVRPPCIVKLSSTNVIFYQLDMRRENRILVQSDRNFGPETCALLKVRKE